MKHVLRIGLLFVLTLAFVAGLVPTSKAGAEPANIVQLTQIGHPKWHPVYFHMLSALIGTAASGYT